jgi:NitT/TauT family transport system substrate-binding protein
MVYNAMPAAVFALKESGIEKPEDLKGKTLGAPPPDGAWAQFPAFASANDIDVSAVTVEPVGFPTREPMLADGQVDAITGFSFSSVLNLKRLGVPADDIANILMADHGLQLYGNAILVNTEWAAENPDTLTAFLRAVALGWRDAIADPAAGIEALAKRNVAIDKDLEQERLQMSIDQNVLTDYVKSNGMGGIDASRMEAAIAQLGETYNYQNTPDASAYFDGSYLPDDGSLMLQ